MMRDTSSGLCWTCQCSSSRLWPASALIISAEAGQSLELEQIWRGWKTRQVLQHNSHSEWGEKPEWQKMCQVELQIQREVAAHFDVCMEKLKVGECRDMTRNLAPKSPDICHSMSSIISDPFSWLYLVTSSVAICALWIQRSTVVPVVCFLHLQVTNLADEVEALRQDIHHGFGVEGSHL